MKMHEYAFDVKLAAVVRVKAETRGEAETMLHNYTWDFQPDAPYNLGAQLTEASVDDCSPHLFEVDGKNTEEEEDNDDTDLE